VIVKKKNNDFYTKMFLFIGALFVPALVMGFVVFEIQSYFIYYHIYSDYLMNQQAMDSMSLPLRISLILFAILICFSIFVRYSSNKLFATCSTESESVAEFIEFLKKWFARLVLAVFFVSIVPLVYYLSVGLSIMRPYDYVPFSQAMVEKISIHESGHALINAVVFPDTTYELRIFNSDDMAKVHRYLGLDFVKYVPGGIHRSNRDSAYLKDDIFKSIKVSLGGLAAEEILSPSGASVGASADLEAVEDKVILLVDNGLSSLGPTQWDLLTVEQKQKLYNEIVDPLYAETKQLLIANKDSLETLSNELVERRKLNGSLSKEILGSLKTN